MKNGICKIKWSYYNIKEELIAVCIATTRYEAITYFEDANLDVTEAQHFILAEYLTDCLWAFDKATVRRGEWYGRKES